MTVNRINHTAIKVTELSESRRWYTQALGLREIESGSDVAYLSCDGKAVDLVLVAGGTGLDSLSLGVPDGETLESVEKALADKGLAFVRKAGHIPGVETVLEHQLPSGHTVELVLGATEMTGITNKTWDGTSIAPIDLDHVTIVVPDVKASTEHFMERFSYDLTEVVAPVDTWLASFIRTSDLHHDLGIVAAPRPQDTLHHIAFWVDGISHQAQIADRLADYGTSLEFGPSKHGGPANQLFMYALDPAGNRVEFCGSMATVDHLAEPIMTVGAEAAGKTINKWKPGFAPESFFGAAS